MAHGEGPPTAAEVRTERRRFERERRASDADAAHVRPWGHRPITESGARRRWLNWLLEGHPELRRPAHAPAVAVSGLVLYVLRTLVQQILEHDAGLSAGARKAHFREGTLVHRIVALGRHAERARLPRRQDIGRVGLETPVLAHLLDLNEKLVRSRLRASDLRAEVDAARATGHVAWVSPRQLWWAARYSRDATMLTSLKGTSA